MLKKILFTSLISGAAFAATNAELDQRIEALEYQSYSNFFKLSGELEYRFDKYTEKNNSVYTSKSATTLGAITNAVGEDSNSLNKVFFKLNLASNPSEKLSFYGRLAARKYVSVFSSSNGTSSSTGDTGDLSGTTHVGDDKVLLERAFANYKLTKDLTLSFGRLPTSQGAPYSFSRDEGQGGNYPFLLYSSYLDGVAGTYNINSSSNVKVVYTPFTTVDFSDKFASETTTAYVLMYEFNSRVKFADNLHVIAGYLGINQFSYSTAKADIKRYMLNSEVLGIAGSKFDMNVMFSKNDVENTSLLAGNIGWASDKLGKVSGNAYGAAVRYAVLEGTKVGVEYFHADKDAWATQSASDDPFNFYATKGDSYKLFVTHRMDQNFRINVGYITSQQDYEFEVANLLGKSVATDKKITSLYTSLIANF